MFRSDPPVSPQYMKKKTQKQEISKKNLKKLQFK